MKRRTKILIAVLAGAAVFSTVACAAHHHHGAHRTAHAKKFVTHRIDHMLDKIDATDAQRVKVHGVRDHLFAEFQSAHLGSEQTKQAFLKEWKSDKPDAEKLHALLDQRFAAYQKAAHEAVDGLIDVHAALEETQRRKITERWEDHMKE